MSPPLVVDLFDYTNKYRLKPPMVNKYQNKSPKHIPEAPTRFDPADHGVTDLPRDPGFVPVFRERCRQ